MATILTKELEKEERIHFDKMAKNYDVNYGYQNKFVQYKIHKKIELFAETLKNHGFDSDSVILEVGCGTGEYTRLLSLMFPHNKILALDISKQMIEVAKRKCKGRKNISFLIGSAYDTKLKDKSIDILCSFYTLHHLDVKEFSSEVQRLLRTSGLAFFCEPNILNPIVYLIKSSRYLKSVVGDSADEWGINPLTIALQFKPLKTKLLFREFIFPIPGKYKFSLFLDRVSSMFENFPVLKFLAGTVIVVIN
jgi:ubiquinone/menaquinone biosynthesis C-methylase UbiE